MPFWYDTRRAAPHHLIIYPTLNTAQHNAKQYSYCRFSFIIISNT